MLRKRNLCFVLTIAIAPLGAQQITAQFDPAHTQINWTLGDVLHTVHGTFKLKSGELQFDPSTGRASGQIVVDVASGQSGNGSRDHRMHKEILESGRYPEASFTADRVRGQLISAGQSHLEFHGVFRIHGEDHELTLPADVVESGDDIGATVHFAIPYVKWGMKNPSNFVLRVDDHVDMEVKATVHMRR